MIGGGGLPETVSTVGTSPHSVAGASQHGRTCIDAFGPSVRIGISEWAQGEARAGSHV